ncbi:hypothetical protein V8C26DRAFT_389215 [Trichoderma gracile]
MIYTLCCSQTLEARQLSECLGFIHTLTIFAMELRLWINSALFKPPDDATGLEEGHALDFTNVTIPDMALSLLCSMAAGGTVAILPSLVPSAFCFLGIKGWV